MEDEKIIELYWLRLESAISETSARYEPYCHTIAYNILRSNEDCEECVNDTWFKAWNAMPPQRPFSLSAFLGRITRNLSLSRLRQRLTSKRGGRSFSQVLSEAGECIPEPGLVEKTVEDIEFAEMLDEFLGGLPEDDRKIFVRRYWYFSTVGEIAGDYGFTESKVKMSLVRTREKLRAWLTEEGIAI